MNWLLGCSNSGRDLVRVRLFSIDPFPPRDGHCFLLSLSFVSFVIRKKTIGQNTGVRPISLLFKAMSSQFSPDQHLFGQTLLWFSYIYKNQRRVSFHLVLCPESLAL